MQPQGHVQVLLNMLEFGMDPQRALDAPRLCLAPHGTATSLTDPAARRRDAIALCLEDGVAEEVGEQLRALGHVVEAGVSGNARKLFGRGQIIRVGWADVDESDGSAGGAGPPAKRRRRVLWAGSDGRGDGMAVGW